MSRSLWSLLLVLVLVGAACGRHDSSGPPRPLPSLTPGGLVEADPATFRRVVASMRGRPLVVNFWATWCGPCKQEMPRLVEAARVHRAEVRFLGVDVEDTREAALEFVRRYGIPFPNLADPRGEIRRAERIVGLPMTQFYRADGELAFVHNGEISAQELEEKIRELVVIGRPPVTPGP